MAHSWWHKGPIGDFVSTVGGGFNDYVAAPTMGAVSSLGDVPWGDIISGAGNAGLGQPRLANQAVTDNYYRGIPENDFSQLMGAINPRIGAGMTVAETPKETTLRKSQEHMAQRPLPTEEDRMRLRGPYLPYSWNPANPANPVSAGPIGQKISDMLQWLGGSFAEGATGFTDTAGHWTDTKPVSLHPLRNVDSRPKVSYSLPARTNPSQGASEGRIEHQQYRPQAGQPQYSSNITSGAAQKTEQLADFLADAARQAQIRQALQGMTFGGF